MGQMFFDPPYRNWRDFYDRVIVPLVEDEDEQAAQVFEAADPAFVAACLYFAGKEASRDLA